MVSAPWSTWNANIKSAWLICFVWLHTQPLEEAFSQKADEQVPAEQQPQFSCWRLNNEPVASADLLQRFVPNCYHLQWCCCAPALRKSPGNQWQVESQSILHGVSQPSARGQTMCAGSWLLSMWGPGISPPREIFGLFLTGALNANTHTYSVGEERSCAQGQSREWTNLTAQQHPVKFIFFFGPSSPGSLSSVAIQALTHARTQNFLTSVLALNRVRHPDGSSSCPGGVTMGTMLPGYSMAMMHEPHLHQGQLAPMPLPPSCCQTEGDRSHCRVEVWHLLLTDPILSLSHTSANSTGRGQNKSCLQHAALHDAEMVPWKLSTRSFY